ncbi:MAG: hypothetical protein IPI17_15925 [Nitrosomonas sp.]|nr:hypothetical protein [Nitrosomonas sp.]
MLVTFVDSNEAEYGVRPICEPIQVAIELIRTQSARAKIPIDCLTASSET